ncbi:hypothetical protein [Anoxybacteroides amylolyticum]|uniref:Helix-hairpin-helix DNA-binding motif class 1 domain-containing protein n=1 Tax=Anoxybacteroides amylolyticum TaxID=294699 RepID=A0A160F6L4_9BACL|nr:hypothetical protein [Anoxybacillus amylolyticus]ANB62259.1 hypothetical protein GFC30_3181 [Anoxybacillus amylolyticus]
MKRKRERESSSSPFHPEIIAAWNKGFEAGAKRQNELDTKIMLEWLKSLEEIAGIGPKTAQKIREHCLGFIQAKHQGR